MKKGYKLIMIIGLVLAGQLSFAQTFTNYTTSNGLPDNNVLCLAVDTAGNMWFGTQSGLAQFDGVSNWTYYNTVSHPTLPDNNITAVAVDSDNNIWVGTDYGASVFDGATFTTYTTSNGLGNDRINYIAEAPNGDIWFGEFSGATVYDGNTFTAYGTAQGLPFGGVNYMDFDSNGDVYMASGLGGMVQYDGNTFTAYTELDGLLSDVVRAIAIDGSDNKWVGTAKGISVFNSSNVLVKQHTKMLILPAPDTLNPVEDVKISSQGRVWTGIYVDYLVTEGGVAGLGQIFWNDYDVSNGLVGPVVRKIAFDKDDDLWVATSTGVSEMSNIPASIFDQQPLTTDFNVYPNPTSDVMNIALTEQAREAQKIQVYNTSMQLVDEIGVTGSQNRVSLSVSNYESGLYIVKIGNTVKKVVVN